VSGRWRHVVLGALVATTAAGLSACGGSSMKLTATFDDVGDLVKNHSVQVADVRVGRVTSIKLTDDFKARVTMSIKGGLRVPKASTAYLRTTSLLGEKFIELRPDDPEHPSNGPFLRSGDRIAHTAEAPEIEFVAEQAISVLGAVTADDLATLIDTGAKGFGGRGPELRRLIDDLSVISATLASRTDQITHIIDGLDKTSATLASGSDDVAELLGKFSETTRILADNRQRAVVALQQLSRLAGVQNEVLNRYRADMDRQIKQVDGILAVAAGQTAELGRVVDWLDAFVNGLPKVIPDDFTQVYMWLVPQSQDPRTNGGG
jgi:phospholipid/cholesterol/gamma-HCH transport system substrate-binding protein